MNGEPNVMNEEWRVDAHIDFPQVDVKTIRANSGYSICDIYQSSKYGRPQALELFMKAREIEKALRRMVKAYQDLRSDTDGRYPEPDDGCIECTAGTVPDKHNTGLCAYHHALEVLGR